MLYRFTASLLISFAQLVPGETALAFYTATNPSDEPITGIATYNVIPYEAGLYFNKIQVGICTRAQILKYTPYVVTSGRVCMSSFPDWA